MLSGDMGQFSLSNETLEPRSMTESEADNQEESPLVQVFKEDPCGIKEEHIKLGVPHKYWIQIRVENTIENAKKLDMWQCVENCGDKYLRKQLFLRDDTKIDQIMASMEKGWLIITVPKGEPN